MKYKLSGELTIWQHCYDAPHPMAGKPSICEKPDGCHGHWITQSLIEIVEADSEEEAIDESMSIYEGNDLEPTWSKGYPHIDIVKESQQFDPAESLLDNIKLAGDSARWAAEYMALRTLLLAVEEEIDRALVSDYPAEVLEALRARVRAVNKGNK